MSENRKNRRWVTRGLIAFVAILAVLTFFSNTVMNLTIPKVIGKQAVRGNLSFTNSATGTIESDDKVEVKGIDGRRVASVSVTDYDMVYPGDVVITLEPVTDTSSLDDLRDRLTTLQREQQYAERTPEEPSDYTSLREAIVSAEETLSQAQATLNEARNRDQTIASAQAVIDAAAPQVPGLQAAVDAAAGTQEEIEAEISRLQSEIDTRQAQIDTLINLGVPTPTPTGSETMQAAAPSKLTGEDDPADTPTPEPTSEPTTEPTAAPTAAPTAEPTPSTDASTQRMAQLMSEIEERQQQIEELNTQLAAAQARLAEASSALADLNSTIEEAQGIIQAANELPSVASAESSVNLANSSLSQARRTLTNTQINDSITRDQAQDTINDRLDSIAELEAQIAEMEEQMAVTEIVAPASGYMFNLNVAPGDDLSKDTVIFTIVPEDSSYSVSFSFDATVAQRLSVGMQLSCDSYWVDTCVITNIKPDPANPRESRIVKCALSGYYMFPGEQVTVVADRANADYDHVIPSSAINEDNTGTFVYVIEESSSPLGDKYTVRRVAVSVEATDGALTAISGEGLDRGMIVTRSEEPLHDGDRVRLEDYSNNT